MNLSATERLLEHIAANRYAALPPAAVAACKVFVLDSIGVALSGSRVPAVQALQALASTWGRSDAARLWGSGERVSPVAAAFVNGYQIHNQEWDCVHEPAVVHPMAVVLATLLAHCDARGGVDGRRFIAACCTAVDIATTIGSAVSNKLRFFRPAMCGALGVTAGLAQLRDFDTATAGSALGLCYSQLSGTMQAHVEGSPVLPMQIGFNARAALDAVELAAHGVAGPRHFLEGPFGYFTLIDPDWDAQAFEQLRSTPQMPRLSHKPFPSGRATHGGVDGALTLMAQHRFMVDALQELRVLAPPLVMQLVDRAPHADMTPSYARLCLPYIVATALMRGTVDVLDFEPHALRDPERLALAARIRPILDRNPAVNALAPQRVEATLRDGRELAIDLPAVLGAPDRPLSREQHLAKFRRAASSGAQSFDATRIARLIERVDELDTIDDMRSLIDLMT